MRPATATTLLAAALLATGCSSQSPSTGGSTPAPTTPPTSTSPVGTPTRSQDALAAALLGAPDVPVGWAVYTGKPTGTATVTSSVTASDPMCAGFLEQVKDPPDPLPANHAKVEFDGGDLKPPYVVESLQAFPSTAAAAAQLAKQQQDIASCPRVTYTVEGGTSAVAVAAEAPPSVTVPASSLRLTAQGGGLSGYDARIVTAQVGDTLVSLTFLKATA
ncbi:MAG: hypothetical protein ABJA74_13045 [Lapillicoccus sp.]